MHGVAGTHIHVSRLRMHAQIIHMHASVPIFHNRSRNFNYLNLQFHCKLACVVNFYGG